MSAALTRFERQAARAAFGTIFPGPERGALELGICGMDLDGYLERTLRAVPFEAALGLRLAIWVLALAPLFVLGRFATLASLGVEDRETVVKAVQASPVYALRSAPVALKAIGALLYCADARLRPTMRGTARPASEAGVIRLRRRAASGHEEERDERRIA